MTERIDIGDVELDYADSGGDGPAVVFVHGLGGRKENWSGQLEAAAGRGYRALAIDQRGHGNSDKPRGPYSIDQWVDDLVRLLGALELERAALVGHSMGCMVAESTAVALGARVWALAMLGGALAWPEQAGPVFEERAGLARDGRLREVGKAVAGGALTPAAHDERPELVEELVKAIADNDGGAYAESAIATADGLMVEPGRVSCPALAFAGELDPVTPPAAAEQIADAMPRGEAATVSGGAHWCMLEAPEAVNEVLFGFLDRARPAGS